MVTRLTPWRRLGDCPLSNVARLAIRHRRNSRLARYAPDEMCPALAGGFNLKAAPKPLGPAAQISQSPSPARGATFPHPCAYPIVSHFNSQLLAEGDVDKNLSGVGVLAHIGECFA